MLLAAVWLPSAGGMWAVEGSARELLTQPLSMHSGREQPGDVPTRCVVPEPAVVEDRLSLGVIAASYDEPVTPPAIPAAPLQSVPAPCGTCNSTAPSGTCGSGQGYVFRPGLLGIVPYYLDQLRQPMQRESWLYRPLSGGWFMGSVEGGTPIGDWASLGHGFAGGYRLGWDQSLHWGGEVRFLFGAVPVHDSARARAAQLAADLADGYSADDPHTLRFNQRRDADLFHWDVDLLYYPWGDTQWRPYLMAGIGTANIDFIDRLSVRYDKIVLAMPLAVGLKIRYNDWLVMRFEAADNIAFGGGSGLGTMHNLSITLGAEIRFGGSRTAYWPWNPGRHYW